MPIPESHSWLRRNWPWLVPVGCVIPPLLYVAMLGTTTLATTFIFKRSDVYKEAVRRARGSERIQKSLGTPLAESRLVLGAMNTNAKGVVGGTSSSAGKAELEIPLYGPRGGGIIFLDAAKSGGAWTYSSIRLYVLSTGEVIDLNDPPP